VNGKPLWLLVGLAALCLIGCRNAPPASTAPATGPRNPPGFEVRYNAAVALARRGSDKAAERLDVLQEMLDEEQQLRSFRKRIIDGRLVPDNEAPPDPVAARTAVESALKAIVELHKKRPEMDLSSLMPAIDKLTQSSNPVLRTEAERTKQELEKTS
jgi:hypothetical protein